ncbi:hypothetical protein R3P38DRAFT_800643 [Favolaschia claudopus]|uniref:Uncharacterized protein n=1 Tax=Favolaschia claudopus TaxID=2862362 RepID=A0AAV9Z2Q5_9AGAR
MGSGVAQETGRRRSSGGTAVTLADPPPSRGGHIRRRYSRLLPTHRRRPPERHSSASPRSSAVGIGGPRASSCVDGATLYVDMMYRCLRSSARGGEESLVRVGKAAHWEPRTSSSVAAWTVDTAFTDLRSVVRGGEVCEGGDEKERIETDDNSAARDAGNLPSAWWRRWGPHSADAYDRTPASQLASTIFDFFSSLTRGRDTRVGGSSCVAAAWIRHRWGGAAEDREMAMRAAQRE